LYTRYPDLQLAAPPQDRGLVNLHGYRRLTAYLHRNETVRPRMSL
jgi:hypothetical protein